MSNLDPVAAAIAAATAAASSAVSQSPAPGQLVTAQPQGGAVAVATPAAAFSMETIGAGSMSVDKWLKVKEFGLLIGEDKDLLTTFNAVLDMTDGRGFMVKQGIKGGNPAQYAYTFDGAVANDGKPWEQSIARIRLLSPSASPYPCVDLPFLTIEDVKTADGKKVLLEGGKRLGYTTSTTNWSEWKLFYDSVKAEGLLGKQVLVKLGFRARTNKAGNNWGVVTFESLGEYVEGGE